MEYDVIFTPPTPQSKGFAKRNYQAAQFLSKLMAMQNAKDDTARGEAGLAFLNSMPEMVSFLEPYVAIVAKDEEAKSAAPMSPKDWLWNEANGDQFMAYLTAVMGGDRQEIPPSPSEPLSTT